MPRAIARQLALSLLLTVVAAVPAANSTADCSGNGVLVHGSCICEAQYVGEQCDQLWTEYEWSFVVYQVVYALVFALQLIASSHRLFALCRRSGFVAPHKMVTVSLLVLHATLRVIVAPDPTGVLGIVSWHWELYIWCKHAQPTVVFVLNLSSLAADMGNAAFIAATSTMVQMFVRVQVSMLDTNFGVV